MPYASVKEGMAEGHRPEFHHGATDARVLGDGRLMEKLSKTDVVTQPAPGLDELVEQVAGVYDTELAALSVGSQLEWFRDGLQIAVGLSFQPFSNPSSQSACFGSGAQLATPGYGDSFGLLLRFAAERSVRPEWLVAGGRLTLGSLAGLPPQNIEARKK